MRKFYVDIIAFDVHEVKKVIVVRYDRRSIEMTSAEGV